MLAQFAKLSLQHSTLRATPASFQSLRLLSTDGKVTPPSYPIDLGNLADNPGAVTEVNIFFLPMGIAFQVPPLSISHTKFPLLATSSW
jgi:hypothetical protein